MNGPAGGHLRPNAAVARSHAVHTPASVQPMPNKPRTPISGFRIPEDVKRAAVERAEAEGKTLTDVVVEHLTRYGKGKPKPPRSEQ